MTRHRHFKIYKPAGYLSQFVNNQNRRRNKRLLGGLGDFPEGTMSIGRLDENSEGLLLLTTDGLVSFEVRAKTVEKEYYVQVDGLITDTAIQQLQEGVSITLNKQLYLTMPCGAHKLSSDPILPPPRRVRGASHGPTSWLSVAINEGKFRQVRKMTASVGFPTLRLVRVRVGNEVLGDLMPGDVHEVDGFDI